MDGWKMEGPGLRCLSAAVLQGEEVSVLRIVCNFFTKQPLPQEGPPALAVEIAS